MGDKSSVQLKPQWFVEKGFVFVSTNYRLLPTVDMANIIKDIAKSIRWVHENIATHGGDPKRIFIMGHSAGAQLAALICTDDRYLKAENLNLSIIKGCVPVDGDTFDIPAIIEIAETRCKVYNLPQATFGHRQKFGNDPAKHKDFPPSLMLLGTREFPLFSSSMFPMMPTHPAKPTILEELSKNRGSLPPFLEAGRLPTPKSTRIWVLPMMLGQRPCWVLSNRR